jgi:hypothetical protein
LPTATNGWREGPPIDSTVSTFSLPALRDDRHLNVAGSLGTEIILNAEKDVPYLPGEPVGQGAKAYDQLFLAWNPATGSFRDLWTNQDPRREDILDVDSGWVLTLLYRLNPCTSWTLRIRNLSTGEVRDVDHESDASRGLECAVSPQLDGGDVVYVRLSGSGSLRTSDVMVYNIASGTARSLAHKELTLEDGGSAIGMSSAADDRISWTEQDADTGPLVTVVTDRASGQSRTIKDDRLGVCQLIRGANALVCTPPAALIGNSNGASGTRVFDLATGVVAEVSRDSNPGFYSWNGWFWSPKGNYAGAQAVLYQSGRNQSRTLDVPNTASTARLVDGWFTWIEFKDDADGRHDWAASTVRALKLN